MSDTYELPRFLYHGTSANFIGQILAKGLLPRGKRKGNWKHTVESGKDRVYLTDAYPLYFARGASDADGAVIEIDTQSPAFDGCRLVADEDFLEQATRGGNNVEGAPPGFQAWSMKRRTKWFRDQPGEFGSAELSLQHLGTCAHVGTIPAEAISRIATIEHKALVRLSVIFDPFISIMNYRVCGERYRSVPGWLFDGKPVVDPWNPMFQSPPRDGILVRSIRPEPVAV